MPNILTDYSGQLFCLTICIYHNLYLSQSVYLHSFVCTTGHHFACILGEVAAVHCSLMNLDSY